MIFYFEFATTYYLTRNNILLNLHVEVKFLFFAIQLLFRPIGINCNKYLSCKRIVLWIWNSKFLPSESNGCKRIFIWHVINDCRRLDNFFREKPCEMPRAFPDRKMLRLLSHVYSELARPPANMLSCAILVAFKSRGTLRQKSQAVRHAV